MAMSQNKDAIGILVDAIEARPDLYDSMSPMYKSRTCKDNLWKEVSEETGMTVDECRKTWKNMRDYFCALRRRNAARNCDATKRIKWEYWDRLQFLATSCAANNFEISIEDGGDGAIHSGGEETNQPETKAFHSNGVGLWLPSFPVLSESPEPKVCQQKTSRCDESSSSSSEVPKKLVKRKTNYVTNLDDNELFALSLVAKMRRLSEMDNMLFRCKVQELLYELMKSQDSA